MKIWITKYALTAGILAREGWTTDVERMIGYQEGASRNYMHKPYWHASEAEAVSHAEELKARKLQSLEKQIAKIRKLKILVKEQDQ